MTSAEDGSPKTNFLRFSPKTFLLRFRLLTKSCASKFRWILGSQQSYRGTWSLGCSENSICVCASHDRKAFHVRHLTQIIGHVEEIDAIVSQSDAKVVELSSTIHQKPFKCCQTQKRLEGTKLIELAFTILTSNRSLQQKLLERVGRPR